MRRFTKSGGEKGFTLVELLAVMAIISILAALLLPAIGKARYNARVISCKSNLKQVGLAISMYSSSFGGWMPVGGDWDYTDTPADPFNDQKLGRRGDDLLYDGKCLFTDGIKGHLTGLGLLTILDNHFVGDPTVLFCPSDDGLNMNTELDALRNLSTIAPNVDVHCSYIFRQLDGRRPSDVRKGRLGTLGKNPGVDQEEDPGTGPTEIYDDTEVKVIAADRNFLGWRYGAKSEPDVRSNHDGTAFNLLYEDGHVETVLNQYPESENDLRLDMRSGAPVTLTNGEINEELDRVWVLYDRAR